MKILNAFAEEYKDAELFSLFGLLLADKKEYLKAGDMFLKAMGKLYKAERYAFKVYTKAKTVFVKEQAQKND